MPMKQKEKDEAIRTAMWMLNAARKDAAAAAYAAGQAHGNWVRVKARVKMWEGYIETLRQIDAGPVQATGQLQPLQPRLVMDEAAGFEVVSVPPIRENPLGGDAYAEDACEEASGTQWRNLNALERAIYRDFVNLDTFGVTK